MSGRARVRLRADERAVHPRIRLDAVCGELRVQRGARRVYGRLIGVRLRVRARLRVRDRSEGSGSGSGSVPGEGEGEGCG